MSDIDSLIAQWEKILGPSNEACQREKLQLALNHAKHDAYVYIGKLRIPLEDLTQRGIAEIHTEYSRVVIITSDGRYVVISSTAYGEGQIETDDQLTIEDANIYGLLPAEYIDRVAEACTAIKAHRSKQDALSNLQAAVDELGKDKVKELLG